MKTSTCWECKAEILYIVNRRYCPTCKRKVQRLAEKNCKSVPSAPVVIAVPVRVLITDAEQRMIDSAIDHKYGFGTLPVVHYRPGSPEFDRISKQYSAPGGR